MNKEDPNGFPFGSFCLFFLVKGGVISVEILGIQVILRDTKGITEALVMHDLALTQKLDGLTNIRVIGHTQNVVVGHARLLLCRTPAKASFQKFQ